MATNRSVKVTGSFDEWDPQIVAAAIRAASRIVGQLNIEGPEDEHAPTGASLVGKVARGILDEVGKRW